MIDPILALSLSMHSNKGIYAVMLGSGVSRSAGIPTGWEIVIDMIRKIANLSGENCEPNPEQWYRNKYGQEPDYSVILKEIAKTASERRQLLKDYFEPSEEERERNQKVPTNAHKAIADLIKEGYIKVVITTNFDRLMEKALEEIGVIPQVIATPDAMKGALPITHSSCTILKLHGDYLDTRIKNTTIELESYEDSINNCLDRILDEYGLIISGWSAEWDTALRASFQRCRNHRFTSYWTKVEEPRELARELINLRRAEEIPIISADSFFIKVRNNIFALQEIERPHPLSSKVAVANLKRYIADSKQIISLHDLVMDETSQVCSCIREERFPLYPQNGQDIRNEIRRQMTDYENQLETMISLIINECYWGEREHENIWIKSLEQIANRPGGTSGNSYLLKFREYPSLLLLYAGGIASVAAGKFNNFASVVEKAWYKTPYVKCRFIIKLYPEVVLGKNIASEVLDMPGQYTPFNNHLYKILRNPLKPILPLDSDYEKYFNYFEYLCSLVYVYNKNSGSWGPIGRYKWVYNDEIESSVINLVKKEIETYGENWEPVRANLFGGSIENAKAIIHKFDECLAGIHWY